MVLSPNWGFRFHRRCWHGPSSAMSVHRPPAFLGDIFWQCNRRFLRLWTNEEDTLCSLLQNRHLCRFLIRLHQDLQGSVRRHCIQYDAEEAEEGSDFSSIHAKLGHASQPSLRFNVFKRTSYFRAPLCEQPFPDGVRNSVNGRSARVVPSSSAWGRSSERASERL